MLRKYWIIIIFLPLIGSSAVLHLEEEQKVPLLMLIVYDESKTLFRFLLLIFVIKMGHNIAIKVSTMYEREDYYKCQQS